MSEQLKFKFIRYLIEIISYLLKRKQAVRGILTLITTNPIQFVKGEHIMANLKDNQQLVAHVAFVDVDGNPAVVDGVPVWASSAPGTASVAAAPDGMSAVVTGGATLGDAQITCVADADLGTGVTPITLSGTVTVEASSAVGGALTFDAPTDVTPAPPAPSPDQPPTP